MRAGILRKSIDFYQKSIVKDEFGASSETWNKVFSLRASVTFKNGGKSISDFEIFNSQTIDFVVRNTKAVIESLRINFEGKLYKILFLSPNYLDNSLTISTELIND